ncbi:glycosyltransferase family 4 protein [Klebsiella pneumoniae]|nr:glycosyltransferase family 4 protein [Klebsiella pneumoniae]
MSKIAFVIDDVSHSGGTERVLSILANNFSKSNEVTVFSLGSKKPFFNFVPTIDIVLQKESKKVRINKLLHIARQITNSAYDVVIIISMGRLSFQLLPLMYFFKRLKRSQTKVISCDHVAFESFSKIKQLIKLKTYALSDVLCVLTEHDKNYISKKNANIKKIVVMRNISSFAENNYDYMDIFAQKKNCVLAVGRLTYQKNFEALIQIWANLPEHIRSAWELHIAGDGENKDTLRKLISELNVTSSVKLLGNVSNIKTEYLTASVLCMTSRYEGLPMVLIEAKDFAIPVISFDCPTGPAEIITDDGFLITKDDCYSFEEKLRLLLSNGQLREKLGHNAFTNRSMYGAPKILSEWITLINS